MHSRNADDCLESWKKTMTLEILTGQTPVLHGSMIVKLSKFCIIVLMQIVAACQILTMVQDLI